MKFAAVFPSIHHVLKAEKVLKSQGIPVELVPIPREISSDCGMALSFEGDPSLIHPLLREAGLKEMSFFRRYQEVWHPVLFNTSKQK
ncbi:DUF3343 domain-containing protein [Thermosulfuriphilus sp.]